MRRIIVFIAVLLLLQSTWGQRGGGGGGGRGGGGSSGGRSSGGRSSGGRSSYSSGGGKSCATKCNSDPACLQECEKQARQGGIIAGSIIGGIFGLFAIVGAICFIKHRYSSNCCCCNQFNSLKRKYNQTSPNGMSIEEFNMKKIGIVGLINSNQTFTIYQGTQEFAVDASCQIKDEKDYLTEIFLKGKDAVGDWTAKGFILCAQGNMFLWFYKEYNNKQSAGQTGEWKDLVYESSQILDNEINGRWFYIGFEQTATYSGRWTVKSKQVLDKEFEPEATYENQSSNHNTL